MFRHFSFRPYVRLANIWLLSLLLASCATTQEQVTTEPPVDPTAEPSTWAAEQQQRLQIKNWEIRGRLGVQTETSGGSLDLIWKQAEEEYSIRLIAPLGAGNYLIQGDDTFARIHFPDGRKETVDNVDDIFSTTLEVDLPIAAVKDWIRGLPAGSMPVQDMQWNGQGLLHTVEQSGWNVEMNKYTGSKISLPHVIYLSRDDDAELDIRLVLRQWLIDN